MLHLELLRLCNTKYLKYEQILFEIYSQILSLSMFTKYILFHFRNNYMKIWHCKFGELTQNYQKCYTRKWHDEFDSSVNDFC